MNIVTPQVTAYLESLFQPRTAFLDELRRRSEEQHVPIILRDTEQLLMALLQRKQPTRILEIGTAVGYSAIFFATICPQATITTLERWEEVASVALDNIEQAGFSSRITVIIGDGRETLLALNDQGIEPFDFVFIDAAKGQYQVFWDQAEALWADDVLVLSDNVLFKGMTASDEFVTDRRNKTIIRRMRDYLAHITTLAHMETVVLPVGDGVAISTGKKQEELK